MIVDPPTAPNRPDRRSRRHSPARPEAPHPYGRTSPPWSSGGSTGSTRWSPAPSSPTSGSGSSTSRPRSATTGVLFVDRLECRRLPVRAPRRASPRAGASHTVELAYTSSGTDIAESPASTEGPHPAVPGVDVEQVPARRAPGAALRGDRPRARASRARRVDTEGWSSGPPTPEATPRSPSCGRCRTAYPSVAGGETIALTFESAEARRDSSSASRPSRRRAASSSSTRPSTSTTLERLSPWPSRQRSRSGARSSTSRSTGTEVGRAGAPAPPACRVRRRAAPRRSRPSSPGSTRATRTCTSSVWRSTCRSSPSTAWRPSSPTLCAQELADFFRRHPTDHPRCLRPALVRPGSRSSGGALARDHGRRRAGGVPPDRPASVVGPAAARQRRSSSSWSTRGMRRHRGHATAEPGQAVRGAGPCGFAPAPRAAVHALLRRPAAACVGPGGCRPRRGRAPRGGPEPVRARAGRLSGCGRLHPGGVGDRAGRSRRGADRPRPTSSHARPGRVRPRPSAMTARAAALLESRWPGVTGSSGAPSRTATGADSGGATAGAPSAAPAGQAGVALGGPPGVASGAAPDGASGGASGPASGGRSGAASGEPSGAASGRPRGATSSGASVDASGAASGRTPGVARRAARSAASVPAPGAAPSPARVADAARPAGGEMRRDGSRVEPPSVSRDGGSRADEGREDAVADQAAGILVDNAGLVLLHPFLPRFFEGLGVADGDELLDPGRALCLLHHLATGELTAPEHQLTLAKVLCGVPLDEPVEADVGLTEAETAEAIALLEAAIGHWGALRGSSPDALRGEFLMRPGMLADRRRRRLAAAGRDADRRHPARPAAVGHLAGQAALDVPPAAGGVAVARCRTAADQRRSRTRRRHAAACACGRLLQGRAAARASSRP